MFGKEFQADGPSMLNDNGPYVESWCIGICNSFLSANLAISMVGVPGDRDAHLCKVPWSQIMQRLVNKCAQLVYYSLRHTKPMNFVLRLSFEDLDQILEHEAVSEPLHSTHVVAGPFDMLAWMRAHRLINSAGTVRVHQFWGRVKVQVPLDVL